MGKLRISLIDCRFHSPIGVFAQERAVGHELAVSVNVAIDAPAIQGDTAECLAISYADLYEEVKSVMAEEGQLLETKAMAVAGRLRARWPQILEGSVKIVKISPPIAGIVGSAGVEYEF